MEEKPKESIDEYLARIRKTIADSRELVSQAELRIAETDRLLAKEGLTREEVMAFKFTREQRLAVNEELQRRGLPPIEDDESSFDFDAAVEEVRAGQLEVGGDDSGEDVVESRRRKFGNFMQEFRL